jgi:hypothetical protein
MENGLALLCGAYISSELIFKPIAQLAGSGRPVYVVDGDNSFRSYRIARHAREMDLDPRFALAQVQVARAFTCYQLVEIVERLSRRAATISCASIVCLGLLGTLYDEDVAWPEAQRLLREALAHLKLLAEWWPVLVTVRPPPSKAQNRLGLIQVLMRQADVIHSVRPDPGYERSVQIPLRLSSGK